ncbi:MAG TPA: hypothetical protein VFK38_09080 [Candidatus Limnocylindrales bacterium]|nr:hypothetical protein [Candidatus Limnocylindrales bacterium]
MEERLRDTFRSEAARPLPPGFADRVVERLPDRAVGPGSRLRLVGALAAALALGAVLGGSVVLRLTMPPSPGQPSQSPLTSAPATATVGIDGFYGDGIPKVIDGEAVLRPSEASLRVATATDDTPFLVGGWYRTWVGGCLLLPSPPPPPPLRCAGGILSEGAEAPRAAPLRSDQLRLAIDRVAPPSGAVVLRVHTRDPRAAECVPASRAACERQVVVDQVVWTPADSSIAHANGPHDLLLRVERNTVSRAIIDADLVLPAFSLYGDGMVVWLEEQRLRTAHLDEAAVQGLLRRASEAIPMGELRLGPYARAEPGTTVTTFRLTTASGGRHVSVYAIEDPQQAADATVVERLRALDDDLRRRVVDFSSDNRSNARSFAPSLYRIVVRQQPGIDTQRPRYPGWPWPDRPWDRLAERAGDTARVGEVTAAEVRALGPGGEAILSRTFDGPGDTELVLFARPLLPDEVAAGLGIRQVVTGGAIYTEGAYSYVELSEASRPSDAEPSYRWRRQLRGAIDFGALHLPAGRYRVVSYQRPCAAACPWLDAPRDRCEATFELAAGATAEAVVVLRPTEGCSIELSGASGARLRVRAGT